MANGGALKVILIILNSIFAILGLGLAAASIWFFIEVQNLTSLRNKNHYLLDYKVYWPQAIPWVFFVIAVLVLIASFCGFANAKRNSKKFIATYVVYQLLVIFLLVVATVIALVFADNHATDAFIKDTVWDVFYQAHGQDDVLRAYGEVEKKLQCCGADSPRDYINWKDEFPQSCCDVYYHGWTERYPLDCEFTNKLANERLGCSKVASQYARVIIKVLSGVCVFTAFIGIVNVVVAVLARMTKKKIRVPASAQNEFESKKVLL